VPKEPRAPLTRAECLQLRPQMTPRGRALLYLSCLTGLRGTFTVRLRQGDFYHLSWGQEDQYLALKARHDKRRPAALGKWSLVDDQELADQVIAVLGVDHPRT